MKIAREDLIYFLFGSTVYGLIELAYRNRTHWTMILVGGIAFLGVSRIASCFKERSIVFKSVLGAVFVTYIEFFSGIIINIIYGLNVWDYSELPLNLLGQICPYFSFLWFLVLIEANYFYESIKIYLN